MATPDSLRAWQARDNTVLRARIAFFATRAAAFILNEDPQMDDHWARAALARHVIDAPNAAVGEFLPPFTTNATIMALNVDTNGDGTKDSWDAAAIPENDIEYVVSAVWTQVARDRLLRLSTHDTRPEV